MESISLQTLFEYDDWANREVLKSLREMSAPPAQAVALFAHLAAAKRNLLARCQQQTEMPAPFFPTDWTLEKVEGLLNETAQLWPQYLASLERGDAAADIEFVSVTRGGKYRVMRLVTIYQAVLHGQYHRGQVATLIRQAGGKPASTDFIFWPAIGAKKVDG